MQLVSYRNTMNGAKKIALVAKPAITEAESNWARMRKERDESIKEGRRLRLQAQIAEAKAAIKAANKALGKLNASSVEQIIVRVCKATGVSKHDILSNRRHRQLVFARQAVMYWICRLSGYSLPQVGRILGGRDHTTVLHGKREYVKKRAAMGRTLREVR